MYNKVNNLEYQYQIQEMTLTDKALTALIPTYTAIILMEKELYKLCYIENSFAYFTTQDLDKQWGDDWDDADVRRVITTIRAVCQCNVSIRGA